MARSIQKLSVRAVVTRSSAGYHPDGAGLYLQIGPTGTKSWIFRYTRDGRSREMGLGSASVVSLASARAAAQHCREQLHQGLDPIDARASARAAEKLAAASAMTFKQCAHAYIEAHRQSWRNAKHAAQWKSTLVSYAEPIIGALPIQAIDTARVMQVLEPVWRTRTETASRLRGRIEAVLDWASARGHRRGDNPARWRGHLDHLLPERSKVQKVVHHATLPFDEMLGFLRDLREQEGLARYGPEFQILTAARTGEVIGARWSEINVTGRLWTVPAERMKAGREHRVALSGAALAVIGHMRTVSQSDYLFPGARAGKPLSNMAFLALLRRMGRRDLTAHGFRSSFRDWAAERTSHGHDVVEMALAHAIGNKVEAAYRRGDLFEKRILLMEAWAAHCGAAEVPGSMRLSAAPLAA